MEKINVYYRDNIVGYLAKYKDMYAFQYDENWLKSGFSISPFSLPLREGVFIPKKSMFNGFFGVFADSQPDQWGNLLLDRYLKKQGISEIDGLIRLSLIGRSGMGALEYEPNHEMKEDLSFDLDKYQDEANNILNHQDEDIEYLYYFGGSSGGARPKALVNINNEDWIVKFESRFDFKNIGECEYNYALACKEIGIDMPEVKLFKSNTNTGYFGIKRFDRINGNKIHMITAAALLEVDFRSPCLDYSDLFKLTNILTNNNLIDIKNLFLRMCFNVYAHNLDDHAKNFSYLYDELTKTYRLSPAYDMVYSNTYYLEHTTSINGKGTNILDTDLIKVGKVAGLDEKYMKDSINKVKDIVRMRLSKYL